MIKTEEITDIEQIKKVRKAANRELDNYDNLSWHIALKDGEKILGTARLYIFKDGIMLDKPCLYNYDSSHNELLFRTLLLKAVTLKKENIYTLNDQSYIKYGFCSYNGIMKASYMDIVFSEDCKGCKRGECK